MQGNNKNKEQIPMDVEKEAEQDTYEKVQSLITEEFKSTRHTGGSLQKAQEYISLLQQFTQEEQSNRALGCIFGSLIGDALGAFCEFQEKIYPQVLSSAMDMPGGGTFNLRIGQYTDDNELAFHLLSGLDNFNPDIQFKEQKQQILNHVGGEFITWWNSQPFDIGITCSNGLRKLEQNRISPTTSKEDWEHIYRQITKLNHDKESNGSLMRIAPMALFLTGLNLNPIQQQEFIEAEIKMTHPNLTLKQAGTSWVRALCSTIMRKDSKPKTFSEIYESIQRDNQLYDRLHQEDWFKQAEADRKECMRANVKIGWAKIAWTFGMRLLKEQKQQKEDTVYDGQFYKKEISWVIGRAGDTDTNAAIVGGLIGAMIGFKKLPANYLRKIFSLKFPQNYHIYTDRPNIYEPINFLRISLDLLNKCKNYKLHH